MPQAAAGIGPAVSERSFSQGEMLSREGEVGSHFRILKVGSAFLCRDSAGGAARPIAVVARGTVFGLCSFLQVPNQISAVAGTSGRYCEIAMERVQSISRNDKEFREKLTRIYGHTIGMLAQWTEALGRRGVVTQVAAAMKLLADTQHTTSLTLPSHTALAQLLGTSRESVARALATLEAAGCLLRTSLRRCEVFEEPLKAWLAAQK